MSLPSIRAALESQLASIVPVSQIAWQNVEFQPTQGENYYHVYLLPSPSQNPTIGSTVLTFNSGIFQVNIYSEIGRGPGAAESAAELIKSGFIRGTSLTSGDVNIIIRSTPSIKPAMVVDGYYVVPVDVEYYCHTYEN